LVAFGVTLYIEDDLSHRRFHSPANRFYEALSAGMAILVDNESAGTLRKAGYEIPTECIVSCGEDAMEKLKSQDVIRKQQKKWQCDPSGVTHQEALRMRLKYLMKEIV